MPFRFRSKNSYHMEKEQHCFTGYVKSPAYTGYPLLLERNMEQHIGKWENSFIYKQKGLSEIETMLSLKDC